MNRAAILAGAAIIGLFALAASRDVAADASFSRIQRGKYLTDAGDCTACHTIDAALPMAGGRPIPTPFGTIYSANITPDRETGIGAWSEEDFYRAMHLGVRPDGRPLYPAFPYPYFTRLTRDDVAAIRAYLSTLEPVRQKTPENDLPWPLSQRAVMRAWNQMFFTPGTFAADPRKDARWNRGAYLVEGPGHCGACHTPKNIFGADRESRRLAGAPIQDWVAPSLVDRPSFGLGGWSEDDIVEYLKTGRNRLSGATGLMAEVVAYSTSRLTDEDLHAIASYLKETPGSDRASPAAADKRQMDAGGAIFTDSCSACHRSDGTGVPRMFPPLAGNAVVQQADPGTVLRLILEGGRTVTTDLRTTPSTMPAFQWKLDDAQIAAVATYIRNEWGNRAPPVDASDVTKLRRRLVTSAP